MSTPCGTRRFQINHSHRRVWHLAFFPALLILLCALSGSQAFADGGEDLYRSGLYQEAVEWWENAALHGDANAAYQLGAIFIDGVNVPQDYANAAKWLKLSANAGNARAQFDLASLYDLGNGVEQSYPQAARWYRAAAEQGLAESQFNLGSMYEQGLGVEIDLIEAYEWFYLAESQGIGFDKFKATERLSSMMSESEIQEALNRGQDRVLRSKNASAKPVSDAHNNHK